MNRDSITVCVDAMGSDTAPISEVAGALVAIKNNDSLNIIFTGSEEKILNELKKFSYDKKRVAIHPTTEVVDMSDHPVESFKKKTDSSLSVGLRLQKESKADAYISAGNTGAVMTASLFTLGRIANVTRPTIGSEFPTEKGITTVFDVGASVDNKPIHLLEYAAMGSVYVNHIHGVSNPRVALLNVGEEKEKGDTLSLETYELLEKSKLNFIGNVEGRDILKGKAEVIVCDGFVGNVVLKFAGSVPGLLKAKFREYADKNFFNKIMVGLMRGTMRKIIKSLDSQEYGGVPLLGVNGISIIGHGSSTPLAIKNMILKAEHMKRAGINDIIKEKLKDIKSILPAE